MYMKMQRVEVTDAYSTVLAMLLPQQMTTVVSFRLTGLVSVFITAQVKCSNVSSIFADC